MGVFLLGFCDVDDVFCVRYCFLISFGIIWEGVDNCINFVVGFILLKC